LFKRFILLGLLLPFILLLFIRCSDTTGLNEDNFSIKLIVKDLDGDPIEDLDIGFSNKIQYITSEYRIGTNIYYSLHQDCFLSLKIYDFSDNLIKTLIYSEQLHTIINEPESVTWNGTDNFGNEVTSTGSAIYKVILKAYDLEANEILFEDLKYICHDRVFSDQECYLGVTDENGEFATDNKQIFLNFFDPPIMDSYDEDGTYLGEFTLSDTIEILLHDQINGLIDVQEKVINEGENTFELIWTPGVKKYLDYLETKSKGKKIKTHTCRGSGVELTTFQATMQNNFIAIYWVTESYSDLSRFEIYRDDVHLTSIEVDEPNSSTQQEFTFIDQEVVNGETYVYDLKAVDLDGTSFTIGSTTILVEYQSVVLSHFAAEYATGNVSLYWTTQSETDNAGWSIYRGESEDAYLNDEAFQINSILIPGAGTTSEQTEYEFIDTNEVINGQTYWYWLQNIDFSGENYIHGPISLTIPGPDHWELIGNFPNPFK